jgi:alpha-tubulin suppressor-like RCC1 family protein
MKGRWLLVVPAVFFLVGCNDNQPTGLKVPTDASEIIRDGAHGGNADFFFLPPLVAPPFSHPDFELGKFNNALRPSMRIEICELRAEHLTTAAPAGLPTDATRCIAGAPLKTFPAGTINVVNLPKREFGWWSLFNLPPDGFYYALWNTRQSNLNRDKFYRIKVLLAGSNVPLGVADIDPMRNLKEWRNARTGEVVQMIDDVILPIPFRVEKGVACNGALLCNSATVTNDNPDGDYQIVRVEGNDGAIAGVLLPDNFLPADGPQSVVFTITRVNTGETNVANGTQSLPCHVNLPLQQFDGCFNFSTTPALATIPGTPGHQFTRAITVVACIVLTEEDPRFPYLQLWSSDPGEPAKPLETASDAIVLTTEPGRSCADAPIIGSNSQNGLVRFASAGWNKLTSGVSKLFGVKTAYAVDLGIGGLTFDLSNIGPALTASIQRHTPTELTLSAGATTTATARIVGTQHHHGEINLGTGIGGLRVTFTVADGHGTLTALGDEGPGSASVTVITNTNPIDESPVSGGGFAPINWTLPNAAGTYTLTATGPATGGPVTFTATVSPPIGGVPGTLTANGHHTCTLASDGSALCWGLNGTGQLGDGSTINRTTPVPVTGGLTFASITGGGHHTCGLTSGGIAYCWGGNVFGALGDGSTTSRTAPVAVMGELRFTSLIGGGFHHTCGLTTSGAAYCWGWNQDGQLGDGTTTNRTTPVAVAGGLTFASLEGGGHHTCGLTSGGAAYCWGTNVTGQLGDGTSVGRATPTAVAGGITFTSLSGGWLHTCGVASAGPSYCWGNNNNGQLGDGTMFNRTAPVSVQGGRTFVLLSGIGDYTCGLTGGGAAFCWGDNIFGGLGDGSTTDRTLPVAVTGGLTLASLTAGWYHTCGVTSADDVYCWGYNAFGQLGDGTTTSSSTPVAVASP